MRRLLLFITTFSASWFVHAQQKVVVKEIDKIMKTYPFFDPDPIARPGRIYPYFRFDGYTTTAKQQSWRVVEMENDYIKIEIMPQIGGKVWSAYEKSKDFPFIFSNHVVKFRDVAMRGAWTSGGMEFNFGDIGHAPTTSSPVDYFIRANEDGSASCFIGATDWSSRTTWRVEICLYPDKAYFMTRSWWYNNTPLETSYYNWTNTGFRADGNLEYVFPGSHFIGHVGEYETYPTDTIGRNLSFYDKATFGSFKSYHVLGKVTDFYGGYWHDLNMGTGHYVPYQEKIGKKAWSWGISREGLIWDKLLTDTDGPNVELQSGRLFNQASPGSTMTPFKHVSFTPYTTDTWSEYWYPVKQTRGLTQGSLKGALNLRVENEWLKFDWMALEKQADTLAIMAQGVSIYKKRLMLNTMQVTRDSVKWNGNTDDLTVRVGSDVLLSTLNQPLSRPLDAPGGFDWNSEYGLFIKGEDFANQRSYAKAEYFLKQALQKNPDLVPALTQMAQIQFRHGDYANARELSRHALSVNTYDPRGNYVWGLSNLELGNLADALDGFAVASLSPSYRSASLLKMAAINIYSNDWKKAQELITSSIDADQHNSNALNLLAICMRKGGQSGNALKLLDGQLKQDPLNHYARFEKYMATNQETDKTEFVAMVRQEMPHETFLEIAIHYYKLNLLKEALTALLLSPAHPIVQLWQAYILEKLEQKTPSKSALLLVTNSSPELVFPFRCETLQVLGWAKQRLPHWKFDYYEALIRWQNNEIEKARELFTACGDVPNYAPFYLAKADLFDNQEDVAVASLEKAYQLDPASWRAAARLSLFYSNHNQPEKALVIAEKNFKTHASSHITGLNYAQMLIRNKQFAKGLSMMEKLVMLPAELDMDAPILFKQANVQYAFELMDKKRWSDAIKALQKAETWPESLGAGEPYKPDNRATQYLMAYCYGQLRKKESVDKSLKYIETYENKDREYSDPANDKLTMLVKGGNTDFKDVSEQVAVTKNTKITYYQTLADLLKH